MKDVTSERLGLKVTADGTLLLIVYAKGERIETPMLMLSELEKKLVAFVVEVAGK